MCCVWVNADDGWWHELDISCYDEYTSESVYWEWKFWCLCVLCMCLSHEYPHSARQSDQSFMYVSVCACTVALITVKQLLFTCLYFTIFAHYAKPQNYNAPILIMLFSSVLDWNWKLVIGPEAVFPVYSDVYMHAVVRNDRGLEVFDRLLFSTVLKFEITKLKWCKHKVTCEIAKYNGCKLYVVQMYSLTVWLARVNVTSVLSW